MTTEDKVQWDKWSEVESVIKSQKLDCSSVVVVCVANKWAPPALAAVKEVEKYRKEVCNNSRLTVFLVDGDLSNGLPVSVCPALFFFHRQLPFTIRRPDWQDDNKLVASISKKQLTELIEYAKSLCGVGQKVMHVEI